MTFSRSFAVAIDKSLRIAGFTANLALLAGFSWATFRFAGATQIQVSQLGSVPELSFETLVSLLFAPESALKAMAAAKVWLYMIATAGCGWMSLLGGRWLYHTTLRAVTQWKTSAER